MIKQNKERKTKMISTCVGDFNQFIEFNKNEHPVLSAKLGVFGKKDSFKLNSMLVNQKRVAAPNYNQDQYPVIDLMFELALLGKLYYKGNDGTGNPALIKTPMLDSYLALNEAEKYVFLLQTYWTKYEFLKKFDRWLPITAFYNFLANIANSELQPVLKKSEHQTDGIYSEGAAFQHHLRFFGMGEPELIDGAKGKYQDTIRAFVPNQHGVMIADFLCLQSLAYWNREDVVYLSTAKDKAINKKKGEPFEVFKKIFPDNIVKSTVAEMNVEDSNGVYYFKVSLSKTLWRKIKLSGKHTLGDLHDAIQDAFDFDDDHLYAFYIDGNRRTGKPIYCEEAHDAGPVAEKTSILEIGLFAGQKLIYLFDFGDMWEFGVELTGIEKEEPLPLKPAIVETKGKSPEQYRSDW